MKCGLIRRPGQASHSRASLAARVVEKDMDEHEHRIERRDQFQELYRRGGVDGHGPDYPGGAIVVSDRGGLSGLQIDRAVNVDALTPARLFDRELLLARCKAAGARGLDATRVREQHGFVVNPGIQELIVALNERLPLRFVELARDHVWLVVFETPS